MTRFPLPLRGALVAGTLLLAGAAPAAADLAAADARCTYARRMICTTEGCQPAESEGLHLMVPDLPALRQAVERVEPIQIQRCDAMGCGPMDITDAAEGGILTLSARQGSYLLKIYDGPPVPDSELETGAFTEVVTSIFTTFIGYGVCSAAPSA